MVKIAFVTGKLAAPSLEEVVRPLGAALGFEPHVIVAKISVAALMTTDWLKDKLELPTDCQRVIIPGLCAGDVAALRDCLGGVAVERGPKDLRDLPEHFQQPKSLPAGYGAWDIEILAEINHANRMSTGQLLEEASALRDDGADVIDLGCTPGEPWPAIGAAVRSLRASGFRVCVDTFDPVEAAAGAAAGAELVLSVNAANLERADEWGAEVVVVPDRPDADDWLDSMRRSVDHLAQRHVRFRLDPILAPIGFGFARSLDRYVKSRAAFPAVPMLMGIGNLTELTAVDSAGVNAILIGFCQELGVGSVLTTQVINWCRSAVREIAVARQLMKHAVDRRTLPKGLDDRLAMLRDPRPRPHDPNELKRLAALVTDPNYRIFAQEDAIAVFNHETFLTGVDAFELFRQTGVQDPSHAFYLGWELMKATLALQLGKEYVQDQALRWGMLTREEQSHRTNRRESARDP